MTVPIASAVVNPLNPGLNVNINSVSKASSSAIDDTLDSLIDGVIKDKQSVAVHASHIVHDNLSNTGGN